MQPLHKPLPTKVPNLQVIGADKEQAIGVRRVGVDRDDRNALIDGGGDVGV